ncbi:MAG: hypothetical protein IKP55_03485, partial [Clostridia bacterium]|nr:hypothetical protein [Clostridia bacterium]
MKALSFGEILWDTYPTERHIGGAPLNFSAHFVKAGGEAYMLSAVGADDLGALDISGEQEVEVDMSDDDADDTDNDENEDEDTETDTPSQ